MARAKPKGRPKKARTFATRLMEEPLKTTKTMWKNSHNVTKAVVVLAGLGFTGVGAAEIAGWGKIGKAVSPLVNWGARLRSKLG